MNKSGLYLLLLCIAFAACRKKDADIAVKHPSVLNIDTIILEGLNTLRISGYIGGRNGEDFEFTGKVVEFIEE